MNFVSLLGLITLLLLSWAISYHRTKVRIKPIFFGLGLQFLLALFILSKGFFGYLAAALLGLLFILFALREHSFSPTLWLNHSLHGLIGLVTGLLMYALGTYVGVPLAWVAGICVLFLFVNPYLLKKAAWQNWGTMVLVSTLVALLIVSRYTGEELFGEFSEKVKAFLSLSDYGAAFLFGFQHFHGSNEFFPGFAVQFATSVLPTIIFFGGFMSVLYYLGIIQKVITVMSKFMRWTMGTSGAESLSVSANIFVGQTEAPLLVRPFLQGMTQSELLTVMVGGFATIAGGVLAGYIKMGVDAGHLIAASVMSAPAALVVAKIIFPELEKSATSGDAALPPIESGDNVLEAATAGISDGFKLALNVGAMLIGFIALIAFLDVILNFLDGIIDGRLIGGAHYDYAITGSSPVVGEFAGIFPGSLQTLFGTVLKPLAWLMGVPWNDAASVGNLLGVKLSLNEFVAFANLGTYINQESIGLRAQVIATYALCGFANFSSIGIQLGGISALAPERRTDLSKVALKAMFGGAFASWITACVAGMIL